MSTADNVGDDEPALEPLDSKEVRATAPESRSTAPESRSTAPALPPKAWNAKKFGHCMRGFADQSFTTWGQDIAAVASQRGETTARYMTEIALLTALFFTIAAEYMKSPPELNANGLFAVTLSEASISALYDVNGVLWALCTVLLLLALICAVFLIITLSLLGELDEATALLLMRLGAFQKLPLQLFMASLFVGNVALLLFLCFELHWIGFVVYAVVYFGLGSVVLFGFALPLLGAFHDTLDALRAGDVSSSFSKAPESRNRGATRIAWNRVVPE